jgi:hypothetical protein
MMAAAASGEVKCTIMRAGPVWLVVRFTVMGTAGLWYFNLGRQFRQNFLESQLLYCGNSSDCTLARSVHHGCPVQSPYESSLLLVVILLPLVLTL